MNKTVGIIGGMGPMATCDLMEKIIQLSDAHSDQEYVRICVDCNTNIPDRTEAILHHGDNPVPEMVKSAIRLQDMGANLLIMPCNTAHYFYDMLIPYLDVPLLHMPRETARYLHRKHIRAAGILATDGTIQSGVYTKALEEQGITPVYPNESDQKVVMSVIYNCIKAGKTDVEDYPLRRIAQDLTHKGAESVILACTELPVAFSMAGITQGLTDPTEVLAYATLNYLHINTRNS